MKRRWRLLVFAAGVLVFAFLVMKVGPAALLLNFKRAGWTLLPIVLLWIPVFVCWNYAWWLTMGSADAQTRRRAVPFWRALVIGIAGHSINEVTPFAQVGGEPFRVAAMTPWLGAERATGSVITYYMLHALSNMVIWVLGIALVLGLYHPPTVLVIPLAVLGLLIVGGMAFIFARHREGVVAPLVRLIRRLPLAGRFAARLDGKGEGLAQLDRRITDFYHHSPGRFWAALLVDALGRAISLMEFWFVGQGLNLALSPVGAFVIGAFGALAINLVFFMPMQAGTKEGGLYLAFQLVGLEPTLGVFAAVVQRLRELTWIGIGLLLVWAI